MQFAMRIIYLDNGNITRISEEVFEVMRERYLDKFGVPGGEFGHLYEEEATETLWRAREEIARAINAHPEEIIFTEGVTEGNNLAVKGALLQILKKEKNAVALTSPIERKCVLRSLEHLSQYGVKTHKLKVDSEGFVSIEDLKELISDANFLSVQHVNQEIGTVQDIKAISDLAEDEGVIYHADATHSFLKEPIDVEKISVDILTISAHVIHGPLGAGALFVREGLKLEPLLHGPMSERGFRAGHPNLPAIAGFAKAVQTWNWDDVDKMRKLRDKLINGLLNIEDSKLNGPRDKRVCDNVNVSFRGVEGEAILMMASHMGLIIRTGSACYNESLEPSHVMRAIEKNMEFVNSSTRFVLSRYTTPEEINAAVEIMEEIVDRLRSFSPLYRRREK